MSKRNAAFHPVLPLFFPVSVFSLRPDYLWFGKSRDFFFFFKVARSVVNFLCAAQALILKFHFMFQWKKRKKERILLMRALQTALSVWF